jgi:Bifunctional DNA primase/polymerase, N-terminal
MNFFDAAAQYVSVGWQVFPLKPGSKEPWPGSRGVLDASDDAELLATWAERDNTSNVAIACGKSGLMVVDLDPRHGCWKRIADWKREGKVFPRTVCAETRSGGQHLYFKFPEGLPLGWRRKLAGGVDIQVGNKYVVAPPSIIDPGMKKDGIGGAYRWIRAPLGPDLPSPPRWLLNLLKPPPPQRFVGKHPSGTIDRRLEGAVRRVAEAAPGTRNDELNKQAHLLGRMIAAEGVSFRLAEARLTEAAQACGLDLVETRNTIASGLRAGMEHAAKK